MKTGFFDRVSLCSSCGAPLELPASGEAVRCAKCGAANQVVVRVDDAVSTGWSDDEIARLEHLRRQDRGYVPGPAAAPFVEGMRLRLDAGAHAFAKWQALRAHSRPGDPVAEGHLTELALLLAWQAAESADPYRERGLLESTLALVRTPHHTQTLRAHLAALAARMGDPAGADAWLGLCDARSADLRADSAYRFARALTHSVRGEFHRVLGVLGGNDVEVPIADDLAGPCALLRANAWEKLGRLPAAVELLAHNKFEADPFGQQLARSFLRVNAPLALCPAAEPLAEAQRQRALGRRRITWSSGMAVVLGLALYFVASALAMVAYGVVSMAVLDGSDAGLAFLFSVILLFTSALLFPLFFAALRRKRRDRALLELGELAPARLLSTNIISKSPADVAYAARVRVVPDAAPPFELETTIGSSPERHAELAGGRAFTVRYLGTDILIEPVVR